MSFRTSTSSSELPAAALSVDVLPAADRGALRRMGVVVATVLGLALTTYLSPLLERFRPWVPGEPWPLATLVGRSAEGGAALPDFAEAGSALGAAPSRSATAESLGDAVAANLARVGSAVGARTAGAETGKVAGEGVRVAPAEYAGLAIPIEDPSGHALDRFYAALEATAKGKTKAITRIAHYGDSSVAADGITSTVRRNLQERFGDAGHGFILIARGDMHYIHKDVRQRGSDDWKIYPIMHRKLGRDWYGYGGVQYRTRGDSHATFETVEGAATGGRVSRFELFYQRHPRGGQLRVRLNDEWQEPINTRAATQEDAWETITVPDGHHRLTLVGGGRGELRLYGVAMERDVPGVVYDSLGLVGAREKRLLNAEPAHMARQVRRRSPDLLVLGFGGNSVDDPFVDVDNYKEQYAHVLRVMRAGKPDMACLLFAPLDQGQRDKRGRVVTVPNVPILVQAQRELAAAEGCAYFDTFQAMGGDGAMWKWYKHRPRLATGDFRHATPAGYDVLGNMFYKALMKGFAEYLERKGK